MSEEIDWRRVLKQYIKTVLDEEGVSYTGFVEGLTETEQKALDSAYEEAASERPPWQGS